MAVVEVVVELVAVVVVVVVVVVVDVVTVVRLMWGNDANVYGAADSGVVVAAPSGSRASTSVEVRVWWVVEGTGTKVPTVVRTVEEDRISDIDLRRMDTPPGEEEEEDS